MFYPINEIFATLQGEATFTGLPSIFIRLQGCNVGCPWCDTKHTWQLDTKQQIDFATVRNKVQDKNSWSQISVAELINYVQTNFSLIKHVVITGGEPALYDLYPLIHQLENLGKTIQIETSGTAPLLITPTTWVTLSPKLNMPGGKTVLLKVAQRANEIKMPIGKMHDINLFGQFLHDYKINGQIPLWLQPLSQNPSATKLCLEQAMLHNWRVSLQMHKFIGIR